MTLLFYITTGTTLFFLLGLLCVGLYGMEKRIAARRLFQMTRRRGTASAQQDMRPAEKANTGIHLATSWISKGLLGFMRDPLLRDRMTSAGYRNAEAADTFTTARVVAPLLGLGTAAFISYHRGFMLIALPALGYLLPDLFLRKKIAAYRTKIRESLPDAIDLLVICVEAGLSMDQALQRISHELALRYPAITDEFIQLNLEQRAGKPRIQAWQGMADRLQLPEITSFLTMLIQTERFGTPIGKALSNFAESLREKRRQAAEEKAAKTAVKITLPLAIFIFPSIFVVLLGPAVLNILRKFPSFGH